MSKNKVWLSLFFGYNGKQFFGMQYQKQQHVRTCKYYGQLVRNYKFGRAARTDKGVHAVNNGISCLFTISQEYYQQDNLLNQDKLLVKFKQIFQNTQIMIHTFKRVTCRFDIRAIVKARKYCYICPKNYFIKKNSTKQQIQKQLIKINLCCQRFIGTHNFHNYSKDLKCKDPKAKRYIIQFKCQQINQNFLKFTIKGQSFVYHQIRKIIGSILNVFISQNQPQFIDNTFFNNQFYVPLAPPFGLYLKDLYFDSYNRKLQIPEVISFQDCQKTRQQIQKVINQHIFQIQQQKWSQWYQQVKQGVVPKFDQDEEVAIDDN